MDTLEAYLTEVQSLLIKEKYPTGISQRQRVLEMEEAERDSVNGYSYFDNGDGKVVSDSASNSSGSLSPQSMHRKKVGKRLVIHETDE